MLDYKGLSEEQIQELIDIKVRINEYSSLIKRLEVNHMIATIIVNSLKEDGEMKGGNKK